MIFLLYGLTWKIKVGWVDVCYPIFTHLVKLSLGMNSQSDNESLGMNSQSDNKSLGMNSQSDNKSRLKPTTFL